MEFGVGIHGEPGIARRPFTTLNAAVDDMFHTLIDHGHYQRTIRVWDRQRRASGAMRCRPSSR